MPEEYIKAVVKADVMKSIIAEHLPMEWSSYQFMWNEVKLLSKEERWSLRGPRY